MLSLNMSELVGQAGQHANLSEIIAPMEFQVTYTALEVAVALVAVAGNSLVLLAFRRERRLRRRTNYYIVSLAAADLLVGALGIPFAIMASVGLPRNLHACLFTVSLLVVLCTISIFCLVAVSVDRYWAILHPMCYSRNVRTRTAILIISICWMAGAGIGFLPLLGWHDGDLGTDQHCYFVRVMDYDFLLFIYFATIITPSVLLAGFYAHIYRVVLKQLSEVMPVEGGGGGEGGGEGGGARGRRSGGVMLRVLGAAQKREVKATQNLAIIVLFFMICWIPLYTINAIKAFFPDFDIDATVTELCIILSHLNSAVNPFLYAYHLKDFRAALKALVCCSNGKHRVPSTYYKASHDASHRVPLERCNALRERPRTYIDSPVWLRERELERIANDEDLAWRNVEVHTPPVTINSVADVEPFLEANTDVPSNGRKTPDQNESDSGPYLIETVQDACGSPYKRVEDFLRRVRSVGGGENS